MTSFSTLAKTQAARFAAQRAERATKAVAAPARPESTPVIEPDHIIALRAVLPIVQRAAATNPTTPSRLARRNEAVAALRKVQSALAQHNSVEVAPDLKSK